MKQVNTPPLRQAARAVLLDHDDRVMLLRYNENGGFWATPGGSLEPGETYTDAVARELGEELGLHRINLGPLLATRTKDHLVGGRPARQTERYYLVRARADDIAPKAATNTDNIQSRRWWTLPELSTTDQTIYPTELRTLIKDCLARAVPQTPRALD